MTWFRVGGGSGVPASLKSRMNAVLNKKFGTAVDYPPNGWPDDVNLLGPLPEGTASGSIVTFSDGADDVPIKSCEVALSPSLDGHSSVTVHHTDGQTPPVFSEDYTVSLGRTIYGGTADIVTGEGGDSYKIITVGNSGWNYYASGRYIYKNFNDKVTPTIGDTDHVLVMDNPDMPYGGVNYASQFQDLHVYQAQNKAIYIKDTSCTSVNDFYTKYSDMQIGYELATPTDFTFTGQEINSRLGNNTMWSDEGDTEVTYRRDIDLALGGQ